MKQLSQQFEQQVSLNPTHLKVTDIYFSQRLVSEFFQDGSALSNLTQKLINQEIMPDSIESIRVVKHRGQWISLDNRRLRVFKDAFIASVPVKVCDLKDQSIYREFHQKRTNKTLEGGGEIRARFLSSSLVDSHFDDGSYVFIKKVLNLTFEQIMMPLAVLKHTPFLANTYPTYDRKSYYQGFLNLILEETRAILQTGITSHANSENFSFIRISDKIAKNPENPCTIIFEKPADCKIIFKSGDALLLVHQEIPDLHFIGIVSYLKENTDSLQKSVQVKIVLEEALRAQYAKASDQWDAKLLGSVITLSRMYETCTAMPQVIFEPQILSGVLTKEKSFFVDFLPFLADEEEKTEHQESADIVQPENSRLNVSQCRAINKFLKLEQGIQLVQGPPGTGKTTMLIALLEFLIKQGKRILVCTPSNKAVQLIAERFVSNFSDVPVILVGVEDKLLDNPKLQSIFIHTWAQMFQQQLNMLNQNLWELLPQENLPIISSVHQKNILVEIQRTFLDICQNLARYRFTFFADLDDWKLIFHTALENFCNLLAESKLDYKKVETLQQIRALLSKISQVFTHMGTTLMRYVLDDSQRGLEAQLLDHSYIIFSTLSVSGRKSLQNMKSVDVLIVDEAGQALEAETLIPLTAQPKKLLLIGDTKQLPATVLSPEAEARGFGRSLLHRLLEDCGQKHTLLDVQYRMHPDISHWPAKQFYANKIQNDDSVNEQNRLLPALKCALPFIAPYAFIDVEGQEESYTGYSFYNRTEAKLIALLLDYLKKCCSINIGVQVGIITFYKGQVDYLQKQLAGKYPNIKIQTVDSFQGCENDIIIISFVRSNNQAKIGFLRDFRRLNVALTRAKHSLMILGNANTLLASNDDLKSLVTNAIDRKCFFKSSDAKEKMMNCFLPSKTSPKQNKSIPCRFFNGKPNSCKKGKDCGFAHIKKKVLF